LTGGVTPRHSLTLESSVPYLLGLGLLDSTSLVRHGVRVEEVPGRNRNFRVLGGAGRNLFLKQAPPDERAAAGPLALEARLYDWIAADARATLRPAVPHRRHWDAERSVLVLDLVAGADHPYVLAADAPPEYLTAARHLLANALAGSHRLSSAALAERGLHLPQSAPWIFDLARPSPASLSELSPAQLQLIQGLQSQPDAVAALDRLRREWRPTRLIHGDVKWSNVVVQLDSAGVPNHLVLLDWEMAQAGDPAWDVGAVLHSFITEAVLGLEAARGTTAEAAVEMLGPLVPSLHPAHRDFWTAYRTAAGLTDIEAEALLDRLPGHMAARLIKSAYEWCQAEGQMPRSAAAILQLGINMLLRPDRVRDVILGLAGGEAARR
jgi:aminoglycoside phosphotransferase (APT) family kinase protein